MEFLHVIPDDAGRQRELTILVSVSTDNPIQIIRYILGCCYNGWPMRVLESGFQSERTVVTTIVLWINLGNSLSPAYP